MKPELDISIGHCSMKGRKEINQDFHGALTPVQPALTLKGISVLLADGISSSQVSQVAAESAVKSFLMDYYCTSDTWTVKTSALQVIRATNSWLYAQTKRNIDAYNMDRGYVCTLSALVFKSQLAHLFHVGDSRIYRLDGSSLEQLTQDHRTVVSSAQSYLARAIGMAESVDVDYKAIPIAIGDVFVLATDGVYEYCDAKFIATTINDNITSLECAAKSIVKQAYKNNSPDNLTIQIVRINSVPMSDGDDILAQADALSAPPLLEIGQVFEGYKILRCLHANHRSHIYLAQGPDKKTKIALKIPSIEQRDTPEKLRRFMMEDWIARRINNPHVLKAIPQHKAHQFIYTVTEYLRGKTLAQWMIDNPNCDLETLRDILEQIVIGLRAFHRKEMLHQDLRPENIMIDPERTVKIIDFGAVSVAGITETAPLHSDAEILGTLQYTAPEYFLGETATRQSDFYSLGTIAYQMLTGDLPYGTQVSKIRTKSQQRNLRYKNITSQTTAIPSWIDAALKKSVHPDPTKRYETLSEFTADLRRPNRSFRANEKRPFAEKNPVGFWKTISGILVMVIIFLLFKIR